MKYKNNRDILFSFWSFFVNGMIAAMTGIVLKNICVENGFGYDKTGIAIAIQSISNLLMGLSSGYIILKCGKNRVMKIFPILFATGFGLLFFVDRIIYVYILMALTGAGWGLCNNIIHIVVVEKSDSGSAGIIGLHTSYAIGSFAGPFLLAFFSVFDLGWRVPVIVVAGLAALMIPASYSLLTGNEQGKHLDKKHESVDLYFVKELRYYICIFLYFAYIGIEVSINTWLIVYLEIVKGFSTSVSQFSISMLWLIIIFARMICIWLRKYIRTELLLVFQCVGFFFGIMLIIFSGSQLSALISIGILGAVMAGISPSNAENAKEYIQGNGISGGIIFAAGGSGSMVLPLIIGFVTETRSINYGMWCIVTASAFVMIFALLNIFILNSKSIVAKRERCDVYE